MDELSDLFEIAENTIRSGERVCTGANVHEMNGCIGSVRNCICSLRRKSGDVGENRRKLLEQLGHLRALIFKAMSSEIYEKSNRKELLKGEGGYHGQGI
jgi:hypothetical protein